MTYDEALAYWFGRINYEVRAARPADLKLERMRAVLARLGNPHDRVRLVHITGTKGKGSTAAMLAQVLRCAGYRVGLFTSPHLQAPEERVQVDGRPISPAELAARLTQVAAAVADLERHTPAAAPVTFFEIGTAVGFLHFCYRRCDLAVIEVGLGGRFDSTNVCIPLVAAITNVGFDHMAQLGATLEAIAYQKAGIIKRRVPVVSGVTQPGPREVVRRVAAELDAPLDEPDLTAAAGYRLGLLGRHQVANASLVLAVVRRLREAGLTIPPAAVACGLETVRWPARIECLGRDPLIILDSAHNVPSSEALVATLREAFPGIRGRRRVVFAVSADKQYPEMLAVLAGYFDHFYLTRHANPRGVPPEKLAAVLAEVAPDRPASVHATGREAWQAAWTAARPDDLLCVTGSVFLAGEVRPVLVPGP